MLHDDDEPTTFEHAPLGARQRLIPSVTFVAKRAHLALGSGEQPVVDADVIDEAPAAPAQTAPSVIVESFEPTTAEWLAIARAVEASSAWVVSTEASSGWEASPEASTVLVAASSPGLVLPRRRHRLAALTLAILGLVVLGGAALPPDAIVDETPVVELGATIDRVVPSVRLPSFDEVPPITEIEDTAPVAKVAKKIAPKPRAKHSIARPMSGRKITVDASSALGGLRPRRAW